VVDTAHRFTATYGGDEWSTSRNDKSPPPVPRRQPIGEASFPFS